MKRIISLVLLSLCITAVCVPMYSCGSTENTDKKGRQYVCGEVVCSETLALSSVDPYLSYVLTESVLLSQKKEALYVTPNMHLFSTVRYEEDVQSVWKELGVLIEDSFDLKIINSDSDWKNGHSFQHITDNLECVYSINKDNNVKLQLIFLKDKTVYLSVSSRSNESIFLLEETEISYYEDIQRPSFEVFTFSVSGTAEEYMVFKTNVLCFYNDRTEFFLQCAENNSGGIHGKVTETTDGYLLESNDGKYKLTVHTDSDNMHFTAESPEKINFGENITVGTGNDLKKAGEYYPAECDLPLPVYPAVPAAGRFCRCWRRKRAGRKTAPRSTRPCPFCGALTNWAKPSPSSRKKGRPASWKTTASGRTWWKR